jgi:hypothetical protein
MWLARHSWLPQCGNYSEQIEGSLAYLDTIGIRAVDREYKRMRLVIESAYRELHNRMHSNGMYHDHNPQSDHSEHHKR